MTFTLHPLPLTIPSPFTPHSSPFTLHPSLPFTHHPSLFLHPSHYTLQPFPSPFSPHPSPYTAHPNPCASYPPGRGGSAEAVRYSGGAGAALHEQDHVRGGRPPGAAKVV